MQASITTMSGTCSQLMAEVRRTGTGVVFFSANQSTSRKKPTLTIHASSLIRASGTTASAKPAL
jgi:hypothetical protein